MSLLPLPIQARCNQTTFAATFAEYSQAWDWRSTGLGQLQVDVYNNGSKDPDAGQSAPLGVRVNQVACPPSPFPSPGPFSFVFQFKRMFC